MKIKKIGHCCLLIEEKGIRILTDPGSYTVAEQKTLNNINIILITHEHADHIHIESLKEILAQNGEAKIFTNKGVGTILDKEGIMYTLLEHGQSIHFKGIKIDGIGEYHALMYTTIPPISNTGYFIADILFYPGDALTLPNRAVKILALPVAGPWLKLPEAIDYALSVKPEHCFPVHDGILRNIGSTDKIPAQVLPALGIKFISPELGKEYEF